MSMKYCENCGGQIPAGVGFCANCGLKFQNIPKPQQHKNDRLYFGIILIIIMVFISVVALSNNQSQQSNNNIILQQQQLLQNQPVSVRIIVYNDNFDYWYFYIDGSLYKDGDGGNIYFDIDVLEGNHKFEMRDVSNIVLDSYEGIISGGEELSFTVS